MNDNDNDKLELGIELVAGMKASCANWDIEGGRIDALMNTEIDRVEDLYFDRLPEETKNYWKIECKREKERLHKQAMYVADIMLKKLESMGKSPNLPKELTAENGAKALLIGDFHEEIDVHNPEYCGDCCEGCEDHCDEDADERQEFLTQKVTVDWTTIKEIYKAVVNHFNPSK